MPPLIWSYGESILSNLNFSNLKKNDYFLSPGDFIDVIIDKVTWCSDVIEPHDSIEHEKNM